MTWMNYPGEVLRFIRDRFHDFRIWLTRKIWWGRSPDEILAKRFKLFVIIGISLIAVSKLLYLAGITIPNLELIIPTLVVVGAFSLYTGPSELWSKVNRYFGVLALIAVFFIDVFFWGFRSIYLFTWPGFILCWLIGLRKDFSFFDKFSDLAFEATFIAAIGIILFDVFTAFGTWFLWRPLTLTALFGVYMAQIPFTFYHLASLIFVPPLVGLGKIMTRVEVRVPVAAKTAVKEREWR